VLVAPSPAPELECLPDGETALANTPEFCDVMSLKLADKLSPTHEALELSSLREFGKGVHRPVNTVPARPTRPTQCYGMGVEECYLKRIFAGDEGVVLGGH